VRLRKNGSPQIVVERENNVLTLAEAREHESECIEAMFLEVKRWYDLDTFKRRAASESFNTLESRWVLKWKWITDKWCIRARLTVRGFQDLQKGKLSKYASTASRWGQRVLVSTAVNHGWPLVSADVSQAFLRGVTFADLAKLPGETVRQVQFRLPPGSVSLLRRLDGYSDFDPLVEVLEMLKPGFGLVDAPRLWGLEFGRALAENKFIATQIDPQLFNKFENSKLVAQVSGHIDDLKAAGDDPVIDSLLADLERRCDKLKVVRGDFEHVGIMHARQGDGSYELHQNHYVAQLHPLALDDVTEDDNDKEAPDHLKGPYVSLVCAMAWVIVTSPVVAVYIGALQRRLKGPLVRHLRDANRVLRYLKLRKPKLVYKKLKLPLRLVVVSDSAFTALDKEGLALRGCFVLLVDSSFGENRLGGAVHILEFMSRKQAHVCRATFSAEMFALLDALGTALKVSTCLEEAITGPQSAEQLAKRQEDGKLTLPLHAVIDAKSLFDTVANSKAAHATEEHLVIHVLKIKEFIRRKLIKFLWWADTRDMVADGLTKGCVDRMAILVLSEAGTWKLAHHAVCFPER